MTLTPPGAIRPDLFTMPPGVTTDDTEPVDLWGQFAPPDLPPGLLPRVIETYARSLSIQMGTDPSGLAMAALVTCAAAIPDAITLQVKRHATWTESARLWSALVGPPSTGKSPIIAAATAPLAQIDSQMFKAWKLEYAAEMDKPAKERGPMPPQRRVRLSDTTIEAAQDVLAGSPWGVLMLQDELSGFFGRMDKYGGAKGAGADRSFWLQAWNGGEYALNRKGSGPVLIPNLSVCLLGGIQPDPIRRLAGDSTDDGLLQRLFPVVLKPQTIGKDESLPPVVARYSELVSWLRFQQPLGGVVPAPIRFSEAAHLVRQQVEARVIELQALESVTPKLAAHVGKYNGMFARLCLTFHMIEGGGPEVSADVATRVQTFLFDFLFRHAVAFYAGTLGWSDDHDRLKAIAGYILAHKLDSICNRDVQKGDRTMRNISHRDIQPLLEQLQTLGWLGSQFIKKEGSPPHWWVDNRVHELFADRAKTELERRTATKKALNALSRQ